MIKPIISAPVAWRGAFVLLLFLAFGLRLFMIENQDIWGDEAWSITVANWPMAEVISSDAEFNPPLYHALLHITIRLFGQTPLGIRYLSVICGILTVALLTRLGWECGGRRLALWAGIAAALSPMLIFYAQEARMYGPALVGSSASTLFLIMLLKRQASGEPQPSLPLWLAYGAVSLIAAFSHYYAFAALLGQAVLVVAVTLYRARFSRSLLLLPWIKTWLGMALIFLPWFFIHLSFLETRTGAQFDQLTPDILWQISGRTLLAFGGGTTLYPEQAVWGWAVVLLALSGVTGAIFWPRLRWAGGLTAVILTIGFLFAWGMNPIMPFFWERYLLSTIPAFVIGVAAGLDSLYRLWRPALLIGLGLLLTTAYVSLGNYYFDSAFAQGEYGRLMSDIQRRARPDDLILLNNPLQGSLYDYYRLPELDAEMIPRERLLTEEETAVLMTELVDGRRRVWLVESGNPAEFDPQRRAQGWLSQAGSQGFFQSYQGATLSLFILSAAVEADVTLSANFNNELLLTGYGLEMSAARPGDALILTLFWQAQGPIAHNYTIFTHLVDESGQVRAQMDSQPVGGVRPTSSWTPEEMIADNYALLLPDDLPPGRYQLQIGAYLWPEMSRLPLLDEDGRPIDNKLPLQEIVIDDGP
jgi:4-amino-4-deoxy-L-arabinose transferase-like glycosyltransferase